MNTLPSMVRICLGTSVCVVISSAVASPWHLPEPLSRAVHHGVDAATDACLLWGYGINERPPDTAAEDNHGGLIMPVVRRVRNLGEKAWKGTRRTAVWVTGHARDLLAFLAQPNPREAGPNGGSGRLSFGFPTE